MTDREREATGMADGLDDATVGLLIEDHAAGVRPWLERLWMYYRNPLRAAGEAGGGVAGGGVAGGGVGVGGGWGGGARAGGYVLGQEIGLPSRITGRGSALRPSSAPAIGEGVRREVVVENDIGWRVQSMVDFMFGKPVRIVSTAADAAVRAAAERALDAVWEASGGIALLQDAALLGHVFGWVDFLVDVDAEGLRALAGGARGGGDGSVGRLASCVRIEVVDPRRGIPRCDPCDYRRLTGYVVHVEQEAEPRPARRWERREAPALRTRTRVMTAEGWRQLEDGREVASAATPWTAGRVPVAHVQNTAEPWSWAGLGEVEPLVPLQDELNTRLSDRANRVTMQSFKMYLARGVEGFDKAPVAPGQVWTTDNPDAAVEAFGGDSASPSEDAHIQQVREALDKVSGIPPVAGGVVQGKIGNLSSANALRVTLLSVLAKTARKRVTYGRGIAEVCGLVLGALDWAGVLPSAEADRGVRLEWPDPLPVDDRERVLAAEGKTRLGVPQERVLSELGYGEAGVS